MPKIKKRKDGRYVKRVTTQDGKKIDVYGKTQREVEEKIDEIKLKTACGVITSKRTINVQDWAQLWWTSEKSGKTGPSNEVGYLNALNKYIIPRIGFMKVGDVKHYHCQEVINSMEQCSRSLQRQVKIVLNGIFSYAVINGMIISNPAQYVKVSAPPDEPRIALTPLQVKQLLECEMNQRCEIMVHLSLFCGLRRGEIIALRWNDIRDGYIYVTRSAQLTGNLPVLKGPKSKAGIRKIPIPKHLSSKLDAMEKRSTYVVPSARNVIMSKSSFDRLWEPVKNSLSFDVVFHQLRHTYATNLHTLGIDVKTMQYLLGHANLDVTLGTYTDIQDRQIELVASKLNDLFEVSQESVKRVKQIS